MLANHWLEFFGIQLSSVKRKHQWCGDWASSSPSFSNPPPNSFGQCSPSCTHKTTRKIQWILFWLQLWDSDEYTWSPKFTVSQDVGHLYLLSHSSRGGGGVISCPKKKMSLTWNIRTKMLEMERTFFFKHRKHLLIDTSLLGKLSLNIS